MSTRITPACAGKTKANVMPIRVSKDHPRLRGENLPLSSCVASIGGSPPLARGKQIKAFCMGKILRITPACAGKTIDFSIIEECYEDHPRLRGENVRQYS